MTPEKQAFLDYLKTKTGGALMMSPKELAVEIRVSVKQQSKLRQENSFPIPHKEFGRSISYSINAIADFILTGATHEESVPREAKTTVHQPSPQKQKRRTGVQDLSQILLARNFAITVQEQLTNMEIVHSHLAKLIKAKSLHDGLETILAEKVPDTPSRKRF